MPIQQRRTDSLTPYNRREVFQHIAENDQRQELFTLYLLGHSALFSDALARLKQPEIRPATGFQSFAAGEELINQGDIAEHVFIIIEGHAEAWVNGEKVGDVEKMRFSALWQYSQRSVVRPL